MRTKTIVWLVVAVCLVVLGCVLFAGVMSTLGWSFSELSTVEYETSTYEISEEFDSISVFTDTADVEFFLSDDDKCVVECHEQKDIKHSVTVKDGTLNIEQVDRKTARDFISNIGLNFGSQKITIYLPKTEYESVIISNDTGYIQISDEFKFGSIDISVTTGRVDISDVICDGDISVNVTTGAVYLDNINCVNVISDGDTGDMNLKDVIVTERFSITRSTGNVKFERCDGDGISVTTDTGDITGSLLTDKVFVAQTDTGRVDVPSTTTGGMCELITDTGDIIITLVEP